MLVSRLQPPNGSRIDGVTSGDVGLRLAISKAPDGFSPLVGGELRRTTEFDTKGFRSLSAVCCAGENQFAFKFSQTPEHGEHQAAVRRGSVSPSVSKRHKPDIALRKLVQGVEQIARRAR